MRYDAEHKERTHKRILTEAAAALRTGGPERVVIAALMGKLGLTHGGFYAHFKSKDELIAAAIEEMFSESWQSFIKRIEGLPPAEALAHYIDYYLSRLHYETTARGCPLPAVATDVARLGPEARKRFAAGAKRLYGAIAGLFGKLGHNEDEAMELATSLFSELVGAVVMARAVDTQAQARAICNRSRAAIKKRLGLKLKR
jgi:TetR/AcrR family transcriptional repressor of nem operon